MTGYETHSHLSVKEAYLLVLELWSERQVKVWHTPRGYRTFLGIRVSEGHLCPLLFIGISQKKTLNTCLKVKESEVAQSCLTLSTPWTVALQVPPFMEFSRQEYWSWLPFPTSGVLPDPGIKHGYPPLQPSEPPGKPIHLSRASVLATDTREITWLQVPPSIGLPGKSTRVGCHCLLLAVP